jgi:hypothetical protein
MVDERGYVARQLWRQCYCSKCITKRSNGLPSMYKTIVKPNWVRNRNFKHQSVVLLHAKFMGAFGLQCENVQHGLKLWISIDVWVSNVIEVRRWRMDDFNVRQDQFNVAHFTFPTVYLKDSIFAAGHESKVAVFFHEARDDANSG